MKPTVSYYIRAHEFEDEIIVNLPIYLKNKPLIRQHYWDEPKIYPGGTTFPHDYEEKKEGLRFHEILRLLKCGKKFRRSHWMSKFYISLDIEGISIVFKMDQQICSNVGLMIQDYEADNWIEYVEY